MAAVTWADVVAKVPAPELESLVEDAQDDILAYVHETLNVRKLGGEKSARLRRARLLLAAHIGTLCKRGAVPIAGPVIAESRGGLSRSYALITTAASGPFGATTYGQAYEALIRTSAARLPRAT